MDDNRGKINHKSRSKQVKDYSGLRFGNITPMDIDGFVDFGNIAFTVLEFKHETAPPLSYGQELAIIRLVDNLGRVKPTIGIIAKHNTPSEQEIDCANAIVEKYRSSGKWMTPDKEICVKELVTKFLKKNNYKWEEPQQEEIPLQEEQPTFQKQHVIETEDEYKKVKTNVEALTKKIDESSGWLSDVPEMKKLVEEQQRLATQMLNYEIEHDLLPI